MEVVGQLGTLTAFLPAEQLPLCRRLCGPQSRYGSCGEVNIFDDEFKMKNYRPKGLSARRRLYK
jgi:hypothetical protein